MCHEPSQYLSGSVNAVDWTFVPPELLVSRNSGVPPESCNHAAVASSFTDPPFVNPNRLVSAELVVVCTQPSRVATGQMSFNELGKAAVTFAVADTETAVSLSPPAASAPDTP